MAKKEFKAESKRLLDLMINSIYTNKEIFLRELISNASDAIDKLYYKELQSGKAGINRDDFKITIETDKNAGTLKIIDNGIGMTLEEVENNLGTIAKSGSFDFKTGMGAAEAKEKSEEGVETEGGLGDDREKIDIIGQFGVGFYSAFMVSDRVEVVTKADGSDKAYRWVSEGVDGYEVEETEKPEAGTEITLKIKADTADENYSQYLQDGTLQRLVKNYSDYIRYPIEMMVEKRKMREGTGIPAGENGEPAVPAEFDTYEELVTLNSMVPLWKKQKSELTEEDYNNFYKDKFDYTEPLKVIHTNVEGVVSYTSLLFIPSQAPYNYYTKEFEKGLQLYSSGVLIMEKCGDLLPNHFSFVKGLVDSQDLSLNISREMLQHDRQLKAIAQRLEKKIKSELLSMQSNDRARYNEFYKNFGLQLKFGVYEGYGINKEVLKDLIMFYSSSEKQLVTLKEYVSRMKEDQDVIYYACGESAEKIDKLPQTEGLRDRGFEILYLTDDVDEFALQMLYDYDGKQFKSVQSDDIDLGQSEEEKQEAEKKAADNKDVIEAVKAALEGKVAEVKLSSRLKTHPVCLTSKGGLSIEMEKVLSQMPMEGGIEASKVLEINSGHPIVEKLAAAFAEDKEKLNKYAKLLYNQALLIEGLPIEDPVEFSNAICDLL